MGQVSTDKIRLRIRELTNEVVEFEDKLRTMKFSYRDDGHAEHDAMMCRNYAIRILEELTEEAE